MDRPCHAGRNPSRRTAQFPDAEEHSKGFRQTRAARRNALLEDYVELIADLIADGGEARRSISPPASASRSRRWRRRFGASTAEGLVVQKPYRGVFLTELGRRIARTRSRLRHETVQAFTLVSLGVAPETARIDAEG